MKQTNFHGVHVLITCAYVTGAQPTTTRSQHFVFCRDTRSPLWKLNASNSYQNKTLESLGFRCLAIMRTGVIRRKGYY